MFTWRCPTCLAVLRDEHARRCPVCRENLRRKRPVVIGQDRTDDWWRRLPWNRHSREEIDAHFLAKPLPGRQPAPAPTAEPQPTGDAQTR